jgi:ATP-dependent Clp protease ATP-binding subunit ClpB
VKVSGVQLMDLENFTEQSRLCLTELKKMAREYRHQRLYPEHLLMQILKESTGTVDKMISFVNADKKRIENLTREALSVIPKIRDQDEVYLDLALKKTLDKANQLAEKNGDKFVAIDWLFVSLTFHGHKAAEILRKCAVKETALVAALQAVRKNGSADSINAENTFGSLEKYTHDLIKSARSGKIDPIIGRDEEIRRTMQVLSRRTKK